MKKVLLVLILVLVLVLELAASASAETWTGFVACANLSVREAPNTSAQKIASLQNGDVVRIIGESDSFYRIVYGDKMGYVLARFIVPTQKEYVTLKEQTDVLDFPEGNVTIGQKPAGTVFLKLDEVQYRECIWYIIQLQEGQPGVGFVRMEEFEPEPEIETESEPQAQTQPTTTMTGIQIGASVFVNCPEAAVWSAPDANLTPIGYVRQGGTLRVVRSDGGIFTGVAYLYMGKTIVGYILTEQLVELVQ